MKILFTHSYFIRLDVKQLASGTPYPPLATLYAAALLRENGYTVKVADLQFEQAENILFHINDFKPDVLVIYEDGFNYLTKMCLTNMRSAAFEMQEIAKDSNIPVIVSGSDATDHLAEYFEKGADYIIIGEAEQSLLELVNALSQKTPVSSIAGIAYCENDKSIKTAPRVVTKELDQFPFPAWDLVDIKPYKQAWLKKHGYFSLNFVTTRGCPYKCNWCAKPIYGNRYNSHSPAYVVKLIKQTQQQFGFTHVWFADDIFGLKPGWLKEFAGLVQEEKLKFSYKIQSRADLVLEKKTVPYLSASGCDTVWMGAESGSQTILDAMDKGIKVEQIKEAVQRLKQHAIKPALFLQFGFPGENASDISATLNMVKELLPADIGISVSYPLPGTRFYEMVKEQLKEKANWTDSDDLHLMFNNTYPAEFYKHLHRYVHHIYRAAQAGSHFKNGRLSEYRRIGLWPYYKIKSIKEKNALIKINPDAARLL